MSKSTLSLQEFDFVQKMARLFKFGKYSPDVLSFFSEQKKGYIEKRWDRFFDLGVVEQEMTVMIPKLHLSIDLSFLDIEADALFQEEFLECLFEYSNTPEQTITLGKLVKPSWTREIIADLGGMNNAFVSFQAIRFLIWEQRSGEEGPLLINKDIDSRYGSIFFTRNYKGQDRVVFCCWHDAKWHISASNIQKNQPEYLTAEGHKVFSGNKG